jgi:site-specific DNA-adenine methylase
MNGCSNSSAQRRLRPFFSYYGGKWRVAPKYPAPEFETIVEPFAGAAGYSLRHFTRKVILCDIDPVIAEIWRYLIRVDPKEILSIPDLGPDESVDDLRGVCQEAKWLVGFWLNDGVSRPCNRPSKWMRSGIRPSSFWGARVRQTIASQVDCIRHWEVQHASYSDVTAPRTATWFVDPPYQVAGRYYRFGSKQLDYADLAEWCRTRQGQVIVCENEGATWLPFRYLTESKTARVGRKSREVYWLNTFSSTVRQQAGPASG